MSSLTLRIDRSARRVDVIDVAQELQGSHGYSHTHGRYVGAEEIEDEGAPFQEQSAVLSAELYDKTTEAEELEGSVRQDLEVLGYGE